MDTKKPQQNNNIQTQLKTIPTEKQSFPGGKKDQFAQLCDIQLL